MVSGTFSSEAPTETIVAYLIVIHAEFRRSAVLFIDISRFSTARQSSTNIQPENVCRDDECELEIETMREVVRMIYNDLVAH